MPISPEIKERIDQLRAELETEITLCAPKAKGNYWISLILMSVAVIASVVAGIGGLSETFGSQITGFLALIPGAIALMASNMKFQDKSNWHYRKMYRLSELRSRLLYRLPESPTAADVAAIAKERDELVTETNGDWETRFSFNFSAFEARKGPSASTPPS